MNRPHPLAIALFAVLALCILWLNFVTWYDFRVVPSPSGHGWPMWYWHFNVDTGLTFDFYSFGLSLFSCLIILLLPTYTLHRLFRRTLHIHLPTALVLVFVSGILLYWILFFDGDNIALNLKLVIPRVIISLAIIAFVTLISESLAAVL